jgi:16S rRNA (guanine527-N7)-methyltransferase
MSNPAQPDQFGPNEFQEATHVSRETLDLLKTYVGMLEDWNTRQNLVSAVSLESVWHRHVYDSAQLAPLIPVNVKTLADFGSGAGFPGLVLAILLRDQLKVSLFEATKKKAEFLKAVAERLELPVTIRNERIEDAPRQAFDVITARAFARLPELLGYAQKFLGPGTMCLFLKGQSMAPELTDARKFWKMTIQSRPSKTHPLGSVLEIRDLIDVSSRTRS